VAKFFFNLFQKLARKSLKIKNLWWCALCGAKRNPFKFWLRVIQVSDDIILMASNL
jgi:hypothetical protein